MVLSIALSQIAFFLLSVVLLLAALVLRDLSDWRRFTKADVDRGTNAVHVKAPSAGFVAALPSTGGRW